MPSVINGKPSQTATTLRFLYVWVPITTICDTCDPPPDAQAHLEGVRRESTQSIAAAAATQSSETAMWWARLQDRGVGQEHARPEVVNLPARHTLEVGPDRCPSVADHLVLNPRGLERQRHELPTTAVRAREFAFVLDPPHGHILLSLRTSA